MPDHIASLRAWARGAPLPLGPLPSGDATQVFGTHVLILLDDKGRVFQVENAKLSDGTIRMVRGRSDVLEVMEKFGTIDQPDWPTL